MQSSLREPWDKLGNYGDNCKDRDDKCAKSASSDDGVACRQVTISLTLGRTGWKAEVTEVGRQEGGEKGPTMSENTWQDGRRAASEEACGETTRETSRSSGVSMVCGR